MTHNDDTSGEAVPHQEPTDARATQPTPPVPAAPLVGAGGEIVARKRGRVENLKPFKKGEGGKPKGIVIGKAKAAKLARERLIERAIAAPTPVASTGRQLLEQVMGDPKQPMDLKLRIAEKLATLEAREDTTPQQEPIAWDRLSTELVTTGQDAAKHLEDLRAVTNGRQPEHGTIERAKDGSWVLSEA